MKYLAAFFALLFFFSTQAYCKQAIALEQFYNTYLLSSRLNSTHIPPTCGPPSEGRRGCVRFITSKLAPYEYNEDEEILKISRACRSNYGAGCLQEVAKDLISYDYNELDELTSLAKSCSHVQDATCLSFSKTFLNSYEYNSPNEITALARSCQGAYDKECVRFICRSRFKCDDLNEIIDVNRRCSGY